MFITLYTLIVNIYLKKTLTVHLSSYGKSITVFLETRDLKNNIL